MNTRKPAQICNHKPNMGVVKVEYWKLSKNGINGADNPFVQFSVQIRLSTYVALKQAECWTSRFGEIREHIDTALRDYFGQFPESQISLPDEFKAKLKYFREYFKN